GTVCVVGKIRDLILQLSKSSIYSTKPLDVIKIDKTFIKAIKEVEQHIPMLESIIHLSGLLGLRMVAEGVEYGYQQQWLGKNNVDYLQGYQFLPPVTFDDFIRYYKQSVSMFESVSDSTFST
uniref:EAL domain-containing protein n=1 Tax=Citrobacter sp. FR21SANT8218 TaxID=3381296 RepID=UPI003A984A13